MSDLRRGGRAPRETLAWLTSPRPSVSCPPTRPSSAASKSELLIVPRPETSPPSSRGRGAHRAARRRSSPPPLPRRPPTVPRRRPRAAVSQPSPKPLRSTLQTSSVVLSQPPRARAARAARSASSVRDDWSLARARRQPAAHGEVERRVLGRHHTVGPSPQSVLLRQSSTKSRSRPRAPRCAETRRSQTCWSTRIVFPSGSTTMKLAGPVVVSSASPINFTP